MGHTIQIVANVGVIASIIFLGLELRDNTTQARVETTRESSASRTEFWELVANNSELASIYSRGLANFQGLSPIEQTQFDLLMRSFLTKIFVSIGARDEGLIPESPEIEQRVLEGNLLRMLDHSGFRQWWMSADRRGLLVENSTLLDELERLRTGAH